MGGCLARCVIGDAVAVAGEKAADQVGSLPRVEAGLQEIFSQAGEVGFSKFFNRKLLWFCRHYLTRPALVAEVHWVYVIRRCCPTLVVGRIVAISSTGRVESVCILLRRLWGGKFRASSEVRPRRDNGVRLCYCQKRA